MTRCVVTGAAGFIGSHLCDLLLEKGHEVLGVDAFIPYYPRWIKEANLHKARQSPRFAFLEADLRDANLHDAFEGYDVLFHEAAMPGLVLSWEDFDSYSSCNLDGTRRVLEAARDLRMRHVLHVSTSSVYGRIAHGDEDAPLRPISPYGVTKLAAEYLCHAFQDVFDVPVTILRYYSVYGPRQRPDMAFHILIRALLNDEPFVLYGDGNQTRSNTFVSDCVRATVAAFERPEASIGETFNIGGGEVVSLNQVIAHLERLTGKKLHIERRGPRSGDQQHTRADFSKAGRRLGYRPETDIVGGLRAQLEWQRTLANSHDFESGDISPRKP